DNYARVRKMEIWGCNDSEDWPAELLFSGELSDEMGWQTIEIPNPAAFDRYRFYFYDFYCSQRWRNASHCLSTST
ncbi:MAG: hypothetical protein K2H12_00170, partial [Acetatifactor sp.]|nr:hypothetical protein [Acetatifactor sp.]